MQLLSLGFAGQFFQPGSDHRLRAGAATPGFQARFVVRNVSRPDADNLGRGDVLLVYTAGGYALRLADAVEVLVAQQRRTSDVIADEGSPRYEELAVITVPAPATRDAPHMTLENVMAQWYPPTTVPQAQWRWVDTAHDPPGEQLLIVRDVRQVDGQTEVALGMYVPILLTPRAGMAPPEPPTVRGMHLVTDPGGGSHLEPIPPPPPLPASAAPRYLQEPSDRVNPIFNLAVSEGRLVATLGGTPAWLRVAPLPLQVHLESATGGFVTKLTDGRAAMVPTPHDDVCDLTLVHPDRPFDRRFFHGDRIEIRVYDGNRLSVSRAAPGPESPVTATETTTVAPISVVIDRVAGAGELRDGDHVRLIDPADHRRGIAVGAAAPHQLVMAALDPARSELVVHATKDLFLAWNGELADHASVGVNRLADRPGYTRLRTQGRVLIGPHPGTAPLRAWFDQRIGDTSTTASAQGDVQRLVAGLPCLGIQGYVWTSPREGTVPFVTYWNDARHDNLLAASTVDDYMAGFHGYGYAWIEGYGYPPPPPPPAGAPSRSLVAATIAIDPARLGTAGRVQTPGGGAVNVHMQGGLAPGVRPTPPPPPPPKRALILSGGAAKGCFEAGAAQWMWRNGFRDGLDLICGVSVGSINGAKLAENGAWDADQLCDLWRGFASTGRIFRRDHYVKVLKQLGDAARGAGTAAVAITAAGMWGGATVLGPIGAILGTLFGANAGVEISQLDRKIARIIAALRLIVHSTNSMEPLRQVIRSQLQPDTMRASPIAFRAGITCMNTGQFFTVTGPRPEWTETLQAHGMVEVEPDHTLGQSWLDRPLLGGAGYVMPVDQAIYASSALPAFMEPMQVDLRNVRLVKDDAASPAGTQYSELALSLPPGMRELLDATGQATPVALGDDYLPRDAATIEAVLDTILAQIPEMTRQWVMHEARMSRDGAWCGQSSWVQRFFDGGLRDVMAIRTALRLGARDIVVVSGDRLQSAAWGYNQPARPTRGIVASGLDLLLGGAGDKLDQMSSAAFQHVMALLNLWVNEVARNDLLLSVAHSEAMGMVTEAARRLPPEGQAELLRDLAQYRGDRARYLFDALGVSSPLGGGGDRDAYGIPGVDGCKITLIGPDREIIPPMDFDNLAAIEDGIALGYRAAQNPLVLSDHLR